MDSLITAAARALASGDALGALRYIALRDDARALALRGIAMAQLGDLARAKSLLRRAGKAFGPREPVARARCLVAEAEIALFSRELDGSVKLLNTALVSLERHGDHANVAHARYLAARRLLLIGHLDQVECLIASFDPSPLHAASRVAYELVVAGLAMRRLQIGSARGALARAERTARPLHIPSLMAEVEATARALDTPTARLIAHGKVRLVRLDDIEALLASNTFVIDACRHIVCINGRVIALRARPVLFTLVRTLAEAWPSDVSRATLIARAFRTKHADESHRARLRVEMGRLRHTLSPITVSIEATKAGFALVLRREQKVAVLAPTSDGPHAAVLAMLADGEAWSSSALALALRASQRTVQRALEELIRASKVQAIGYGRARRWMTAPVPGFPTALLLPAAPPGT